MYYWKSNNNNKYKIKEITITCFINSLCKFTETLHKTQKCFSLHWGIFLPCSGFLQSYFCFRIQTLEMGSMKISDTPFFNKHPLSIVPTTPFLWKKSDPPFIRKFEKLSPTSFIKGEGSLLIKEICACSTIMHANL